MKLEFKEVHMQGDGNCLYYSLGRAFGKSQQRLRNMFSEYMVKNAKKKINGLELDEWVKLEKSLPLVKYAEMMRWSGVWGGSLEINIAQWMFRRNIFVLMREGKKYKVVSSYVENDGARNVFLVYNGVHYNYLEVTKNLAGIKT